MAHPNLALIDALRETAKRLKQHAHYAWGNHGSCNCGNLLQVVTKLDQKEILQFARTGVGEWTELSKDYCGVICFIDLFGRNSNLYSCGLWLFHFKAVKKPFFIS